MYVVVYGNTAVLIESIGKTVGITWFYRYVWFLSYSLQDYSRSCRGEVPSDCWLLSYIHFDNAFP